MSVKLFDFVECRGLYKKAHDGRFIYLDETTLTGKLIDTNIVDEHNDGVVDADVESVEKTYYEYTKANCRGVVVGFVDLVIKGYLDVIYQDECDVGVGIIPEKFFVSKRPKDVVRCAVVYYASNRKHYVPLEDITVANSK